MDLLTTLRAQHREIGWLSEALERALAAGDAAAAGRTFGALAPLLTAHLRLEEDQLYPALTARAFAEGAEAGWRAARFETGMARVAAAVRRVLAWHTERPVDPARLAADWRAAAQALGARTVAEEEALFPLFARGTAARWPNPPGLR